MKILYYTMGEATKEDAIESMQKMGCAVDVFEYEMRDYNLDGGFSNALLDRLDGGGYDFIFAFYFIPLIAKLAFFKKIRYVSWNFDAWPFTFYSQMIQSPYNYIFTFDRWDCEELLHRGAPHAFHLPLAINPDRLRRLFRGRTVEKQADLVFIGNLYNGDDDFVNQIHTLPDYWKGYLDALAASQLALPGNGLIAEMASDALAKSLGEYFSIEDLPEYTWTQTEIVREMLCRKASSMERLRFLSSLSKRFSVRLYSGSDCHILKDADCAGYCDYLTEFPLACAGAKINLNFTPRNIASGMSLRVLDIMASGGFLLSNYQPELMEYFEEGKDFAAFYNLADLHEKAAWYLSHEKEREAIAANGQKKVLELFSYEGQLQKMFEAAGG